MRLVRAMISATKTGSLILNMEWEEFRKSWTRREPHCHRKAQWASAPHPEKPLAKEGAFSRITWSGKLPRFRNKEDVLVIWGKSSFRGVAQTAGRLNDRGLHNRGTRETHRWEPPERASPPCLATIHFYAYSFSFITHEDLPAPSVWPWVWSCPQSPGGSAGSTQLKTVTLTVQRGRVEPHAPTLLIPWLIVDRAGCGPSSGHCGSCVTNYSGYTRSREWSFVALCLRFLHRCWTPVPAHCHSFTCRKWGSPWATWGRLWKDRRQLSLKWATKHFSPFFFIQWLFCYFL